MKLKKGVYGKIFYGFSAFACANVVMFLLCIFGLEDDNYNMQFFSFIILLGLLLIFQGVYFHR